MCIRDRTVTISATLYFPWAGGYGLATEQRDVVKTESEGVAAALVSALLAGSQSGDGVRRLMPEGTQLRSVTVENGVCTVDLSGEFLSGMPDQLRQKRVGTLEEFHHSFGDQRLTRHLGQVVNLRAHRPGLFRLFGLSLIHIYISEFEEIPGNFTIKCAKSCISMRIIL